MRIFVVLLTYSATAFAIADDLQVTPATQIANGNMTVMQPAHANATELLIHFHGAPGAIRPAFARSELNAVLVVVNFPGLSTTYSKPFEQDAALFDKILERATSATDASRQLELGWQRITVSSFSAGYGAVREILKTPSHFDHIDAIVTADSIYAGLQQQQPNRKVDDDNMRDFLRFAVLAAKNDKAFVLSHSAQATPYASTTETADYLLKSLGISRTSDNSHSTKTMRQTSRAIRGRFTVLGFEGTSGQEHMQHLHNIDILWKQLPRNK